MASRTWKGSISFGLVNIPVGVYLATKNAEFSFNQLCTNGHRIRYKKWCPNEEREVTYSEIKKGYEITKDQYVVLEKKDLERIKLKSTNTIDIKEFVDEKELDPIMIEKSYFIAPDNKNKNDKAYSLLVKVLTETKKIAVGKIVLKDKEHVVALRPYQRAMVMHLLHYLDDIRPVDEISELKDLQRAAVDNKELSLGKLLQYPWIYPLTNSDECHAKPFLRCEMYHCTPSAAFPSVTPSWLSERGVHRTANPCSRRLFHFPDVLAHLVCYQPLINILS